MVGLLYNHGKGLSFQNEIRGTTSGVVSPLWPRPKFSHQKREKDIKKRILIYNINLFEIINELRRTKLYNNNK